MEQDMIEQLQIVEQSLSSAMQQKQFYQKQVLEMENALLELQSTSESYVIVGTVMIKKPVMDITKQLLEKKDVFSLRVESLEKKELALREQAKQIQESILLQEKNK